TDKRPADIPVNPHTVYAKKWQSWWDFLGCPPHGCALAGTWRPYSRAMKFVRSLGLRSHKKYLAWARTHNRPGEIPMNANQVYRNTGWVNWPHFLGTSRYDSRYKGKTFIEARAEIRSLGFPSVAAYYTYMKSDKRPRDIPFSPDSAYKGKGWTN